MTPCDHLLTSCELTTSCLSTCSRRRAPLHSWTQVQSQRHTTRTPESASTSPSSVTNAPMEMELLDADAASSAAVVLVVLVVMVLVMVASAPPKASATSHGLSSETRGRNQDWLRSSERKLAWSSRSEAHGSGRKVM